MVTQRLDDQGVPYMISGSVALSVYVTPRMTRDIDIVVDVAPHASAALQRVFADAFYVDASAIERAVADRRMFNAIHLDTLFKIDILIRKDSPYRVAEFVRRRQVPFGEKMVSIVSPEDLLLSKLEWWAASESALQWTDLTLLATLDLDWGYVERWAGDLGLRESLARLRV